jgi:hypothetical protein
MGVIRESPCRKVRGLVYVGGRRHDLGPAVVVCDFIHIVGAGLSL